jgi:hypothetical protein
VAVLLLVLLAPGGSAASVPSESQTDTEAVFYTPVPTTEPDPVINPVPTTEPDIAVSLPEETEKPTQTAKPTAKPIAKPTAKPTATPAHKPTSTPSPPQTTTATPVTSPSSGGTDLASLVAFYTVSSDSYYDSVGYSTNHYEYTEEEVIVLARIMQIEAGRTNKQGMIAVGNVILNRVLCGRFGSTITAVVTANNQFSYDETLTPNQTAIAAAHSILDDEVWLVPQNTYFFKGSGTEGVAWGSHPYCATIGGNYFYTHNYSGRYNGSSVPPALFERVYKYAQYGCKPAERVKRIQAMLSALGYEIANIDGYFGQGTKNALIAFQRDRGLTADGIAGPSTVESLITAFGLDTYIANYCS